MNAPALIVLTRDAFIARRDGADLLAVAGIGGPNSSAGRTLNTDKIDAVLARANDEIASRVMPRYPRLADVATETMPEALKGCADDMAWYWLRDREGDRGTVDEIVRKRFEDAQAYLRAIARGEADLSLDLDGDGQPDPGLSPGSAAVADFPPARAPGVLEGYR